MKKPDCRIPTYTVREFTWAPGSSSLSQRASYGFAEASSLRIPAGKQPGERVWNDACDVGFLVEGDTKTVLFTQQGEERNPDGSFRCWVFVSETGMYEIRIIND